MASLAPFAPTTTAPLTRSVNGQLRLTYPTRGYAVTRNPFSVWWVLPSLTLTFAALAIAMTVITDQFQAITAVSAFAVVAAGLLLIPSVALKGSLNLTHDGITFERGKDHMTVGWDQVTGLIYRKDAGLCLTIFAQQQTKATWTMPGGFRAAGSVAQIPLRFFGDRQFSILYDIRERLPERTWRPALEHAEAQTRPTWRCEAVYAGVVAISGIAIFSSYLAITS